MSTVDMRLLKGIDLTRDICSKTRGASPRAFPPTTRCCGGRAAWASPRWSRPRIIRLTKHDGKLKLVEIHREDIESLPALMAIRGVPQLCFIVFCDDLSFDAQDTSYKSLKAALDGGIEGRPENMIFYATSNRRHLLPRDMIENESSTAINPSEAVQEKVSLSDRFGLWLGFHHCSQDEFLEMVEGYAAHYKLPVKRAELYAGAIEWSVTRGSRSGRVAWQYIQDLAGRTGTKLTLN